MNRGFFILLVNFLCEILSSIDMFFVCGKVFIVVNDLVFQSVNLFRYVVFIFKVFVNREERKFILLKYIDGGIDQRNNLESVCCVNICLF